MEDYARAASVERGRCFRFVYDEHGNPAHCPEPIVAKGWTKLDRWYEVDACAEHAAQLRRPQFVQGLADPRQQAPPEIVQARYL